MWRKPLAYATAAALIGFTIMMLPLALETGPPTYQPQLEPFNKAPNYSEMTDGHDDIRKQNGLTSNTPTTILTGFLPFIGLVAAFSVYITFKRRLS